MGLCMQTALIDGDEVAYKIASTYQNKYYVVLKDDKVLWKTKTKEEAVESIGNRDDLEIEPAVEELDTNGYKDRITKFIDSIISDTNSSNYRLFFSGENNFRHALATLQPYKGNRDPTLKPVCYSLIRKECEDRGAEYVDYLEADDLLSAYNVILPEKTIICSSDKDLRTVSCTNYNITTKKIIEIDQDEAMYNFYYQLLVGDEVDNIPSPYYLGPVTAKAVLKELYGSSYYFYYEGILPCYEKYLLSVDKEGNYKTKWYNGQDIHDVLWEVGNLLWMHRTLDKDERWGTPDSYKQMIKLIGVGDID